MSSFKDLNGRTWTLALDAPTIRAVRKELDGLDLASVDGAAYERLAGDPCLLVDCLWLLCRDQAQTAGVTDVQFGKALVGDSIEGAATALLEAIVDFFPQSRRTLARALAEESQEIRGLAIERALAKINDPAMKQNVVDAMEQRMDAEIKRTLEQLSPTPSSSATASPDSSASVPAESPSAS